MSIHLFVMIYDLIAVRYFQINRMDRVNVIGHYDIMPNAVHTHSIADLHNSTHFWQGPTIV